MTEIRFTRDAEKYLNALDRPTQRRIHTAIRGLLENPPRGDIKALVSYSDDRKRLRVGKYRIMFRFNQEGDIEILLILDINSRGDVYKRKGKSL